METAFRTVIEAPAPIEPLLKLDGGPIVMLGSCFADEMGSRLMQRGYRVVCNPFGPLFNPASLAACVERIAGRQLFTEADLQWSPHGHPHVWEASASVTACPDPLARLNELVDEAHRALREAQRLFITLGTTRVFVNRITGKVVANCHKYPSATFIEKTLSLEDVGRCLVRVEQAVSAPVTATVSPVLHPGPGGLRASFLGKAVMRVAIEQSGLHYFPAYEALACDLRDYRFYGADMRHPSPIAADYIFALLEKYCLDPDEAPTRNRNLGASRLKAHRNIINS